MQDSATDVALYYKAKKRILPGRAICLRLSGIIAMLALYHIPFDIAVVDFSFRTIILLVLRPLCLGLFFASRPLQYAPRIWHCVLYSHCLHKNYLLGRFFSAQYVYVNHSTRLRNFFIF